MEQRFIKCRVLIDEVWYYATLDEITSNLGWEYGIPDNVFAFHHGEHKTQFTGLLDKNGKEIYEADVIRCYTKSGKEIVYDHEVKLPHFYQEIWSQNEYGLPADLGQRTMVEVIGNIYENPELLTPQAQRKVV